MPSLPCRETTRVQSGTGAETETVDMAASDRPARFIEPGSVSEVLRVTGTLFSISQTLFRFPVFKNPFKSPSRHTTYDSH